MKPSSTLIAALALHLLAAPARGKDLRPAHAGRPAAADTSAPVVPSLEALRRLPLHPHPRLLARADRFEEIRGLVRTDPEMRHWYGILKRRADGFLTDGSLPLNERPNNQLLDTSRRVIERVTTLALLARIDGDPRYRERAWEELSAAAAFPDWNPRHMLDVGEMTTAFALGYDWLYDEWSEERRELLRRAIVEKGLHPALRVYRGEVPTAPGTIGKWAKAENNWNLVTNGGVTIGALAVMEHEPAMAAEVLRGGLTHLPIGLRLYGPDGAWNEGPGYWHYATLFATLTLSALETSLGTDFGLSGIEGVSETGWFPIFVTGPFGPTFGFADFDRKRGPAIGAELYWLARRFRQPAFGAYQLRLGRDLTEGRSSALNLLWYDPEMDWSSARDAPLDRYFRTAEIAFMRSAWNDPEALWVGFKAGANEVGHAHLDLGTFVFDALGVRWGMELGSDTYSLPGYFQFTGLEGKRWSYYRMRAEGQNTLVLNPDMLADQDPDATTRITRFESRPDRAFAIATLSPAYRRHARHVTRGLALLNDRTQLLIQDEVWALKPSTMWWSMHTEADVAVQPDASTAVLTRDGKRLWAMILGPAGARFQVLDAEPLPGTADPKGQAENTGIRKLAVRLDRVVDVRLAILLVPLPGDAAPPRALPPVQPLARW